MTFNIIIHMTSNKELWWIDLLPESVKRRRLYMRVLTDEIWTKRKEIQSWKLRLKWYQKSGRLTEDVKRYILEAVSRATGLKRRAENQLGSIVTNYERVWDEWGRLIIGLSPHLMGRMIALIYTPLRFKHVSQLWAYINDCVERREQYSRRLKTVFYDAVTAFIRLKHPFYYRLYNWAKTREIRKTGKRWIADLRAKRIVRKMFVAHLFEVWYPLDAELVGLKVSDDVIKPYAIAYLNHTWIRAQEVINWNKDISEVLGSP